MRRGWIAVVGALLAAVVVLALAPGALAATNVDGVWNVQENVFTGPDSTNPGTYLYGGGGPYTFSGQDQQGYFSGSATAGDAISGRVSGSNVWFGCASGCTGAIQSITDWYQGTVLNNGQLSGLSADCPDSGGDPIYVGTWTANLSSSPTAPAPPNTMTPATVAQAAKVCRYQVSGTIYGMQCGDPPAGCQRSGLEDQGVLVKGTASDGSAVSETDQTDADGNWSVEVPPGSYTAGPSDDDVTFLPPAFAPQTRPVTVTNQPVPNQNFSVCTEPTDSSGSAAPPGSGLWSASDGFGPMPASHSAAASAVDQCISDYTVTVKASIAQKMIVDPSTVAHFNVSGNLKTGFNDSKDWTGVATSANRQWLNLSPEFPECATEEEMKNLLAKDARVRSYSYITGGVLGGVKIPMEWNQDTKKVHFLRGIKLLPGYLTRHFVWQASFPSEDYTKGGHNYRVWHTQEPCAEENRVPVLAMPVDGGDSGIPSVKSNQFTIVLTWGFPFDPPGVKVDPESSAVQSLATKASEIYEYFGGKFEALPKPVRFLIEFAVKYVIAGKVLHWFKHAGVGVASLLSGKAPSYIVRTIKFIASLDHFLHNLHTGTEWLDFLGSYLWGPAETSPQAYPVMGAVVRGQFDTDWHTESTTGIRRFDDSRLAVSVATTLFPNITLSIQRYAQAGSTKFNGLLPAAPGGAGKIRKAQTAYYDESRHVNVNNNHYFALPAPENDQRGAAAVKALQDVIGQTQHDGKPSAPLAESVRESGGPAGKFTEEQELAPEPECSDPDYKDGVGQPLSYQTICWVMEDGLP
jgi:hypothetical protein